MHRIGDEGLAALTVFDTLDETGREQFRAHLADVRAGRPNEGSVEVQWVRSDGSTLWVLCSETVLTDDQGRPRALLHRYSDNTERHELISSLRASEDALEDQVAQNRFMQAIASAANEAASLDEVLVHAQSLVLAHDDWERARAFVPAGDGGGRVEPYYPIEADRVSDVGDPRAVAELELAQRAHDAGAPVWDHPRWTLAFPVQLAGETFLVLTITSSRPLYRFELIESMVSLVAEQLARVAERERAQADVARARDEAMAASQQKSDFVAHMSHEIRTPLNGVIGLNDLLLRTRLTPEQQRLSAGVHEAGQTLLGLINDILDFSKIEAGRLELEHVPLEVRPLLDQVAAMLSEQARAKGLDLVVSCHPDVPAVLMGDPTRLAQVVTNLVSNAVKFTEQGRVSVRATASSAGKQVELRVEVTDTGVGVPRSKRADLFAPFTQGDSSTTRVYGGTGLGLAISRQIVDAMGGTLDYAPGHAGGSIFTCRVVLDRAGEGACAASADDDARRLLGGRRALVVAGQPHGAVLAEQLAWWDVASDVVTSAADAHPLLDGEAYDIVVVDGSEAATLSGVPVHEVGSPHLATLLRVALLRLLTNEPDPETDDDPAAEPPSKGWVLVVEDNPVNQLVATGLLEALGYTTDTAEDGLAAIEAARQGGFDAILMDVQMPHMDGYTATRHIRAHETGRRCPIIAMTAGAVEGERERCLAAGMDDFLTKPVDAARLAETLERWLAAPPTYADRLDVDRLEELRTLDDPTDGSSYVDRAIANFLGGAADHLAALRSAAEAGDVHQLRAVAHKLAGSALNLGAVSLGNGARALEERIVEGAFEEAVAAVPELAEAMAADLEALRSYQREQFPARVS
jgi:signal transduction histidine kinase/CheY-like chemotaxis protein/HPt (histidine-containing phosphotransfer) domain-containing protein